MWVCSTYLFPRRQPSLPVHKPQHFSIRRAEVPLLGFRLCLVVDYRLLSSSLTQRRRVKPTRPQSTMADPFPNPVTIDRSHLETLDHEIRSESVTNGAFVTMTKNEFNSLLLAARQLANLKRSLMGAGVSSQHIATLVMDNGSVPHSPPYEITSTAEDHNPTATEYCKPTAPVSTYRVPPCTYFKPSANYSSGNESFTTATFKPHVVEDQHGWANADYSSFTVTPSVSAEGHFDTHHEPGSVGQTQNSRVPPFARICQRTVALTGLVAGTTLADITNEIRGGQLLEVYLRAAERRACVSFLREEDAVRYYNHVKKHDLYINHKRVSIEWNDRQFALVTHVAFKIANGTSRNMIIRRCNPKHTEESIRDDLEHIHNLAVISVEFRGNSCYVKTNSVHNAIYARTCMLSRSKYKGSKIEWDKDECAQPLEVPEKQAMHPVKPAAATLPAPTKLRNRFDLLRVDDDDNGSDDRFDTSSMMSTVNVCA
ncbi:hypothetical protein F5Y18DRAFT_392329 [Xylariaceae sp. FL1019]|nr:hypothetical protein F5Y18DRAFT_392329 [Xylariaceae sp. FL1019]